MVIAEIPAILLPLAAATPTRKRKVPVVVVPVKSSVPASPLKLEPALSPAFHRLTPLLTSTTKLALPTRLLLLERIYAALESVCWLAAERDQPAPFLRIKKAAENIVGRYHQLNIRT